MTDNANNLSQDEREKLLKRLAKMKTLSENAGATEGERNAALSQIQTILNKYNLHLSEIGSNEADKTEKREKTEEEGWGYPWARRAARSVGELYFCYYFYSSIYYKNKRGMYAKKTDRVKHCFVGRDVNAQVAASMAGYVLNSIVSEAGKRMRADNQDWAWHTDFCKGASQAIVNRCYEMIQEATKPAANAVKTTSTALVLASVYENEKKANTALVEATEQLVKKRSSERGAGHTGGYGAGVDFGKKVNLNRQLT